MRPWAKLWSATSEDLKVAELLAESPLAEALRCHSLARASCHGILPGEPALFKARVAPAADIRMAEIASCVNLLVERGFYLRFESGGHTYLYIIHYGQWQEVEWQKTGRPEFPIPEEWVWPDDLLKLAETRPDAFAKVADQLTKRGARIPDLASFAVNGHRPVSDQSPTSLRPVALESRGRVENDSPLPPNPPDGGKGFDGEVLDGTVPGNHCAYSDPDLNELDVAFSSWRAGRRQNLRREIAEMSLDPEVQIRCRQYDDPGGALTRSIIVQHLLGNRPIGGHPNTIVTNAVKEIAKRFDADERTSTRASPPPDIDGGNGSIRRLEVHRNAQG